MKYDYYLSIIIIHDLDFYSLGINLHLNIKLYNVYNIFFFYNSQLLI